MPSSVKTFTKTQFFQGFPTTKVLSSVIFIVRPLNPHPPGDVEFACSHVRRLVRHEVSDPCRNLFRRFDTAERRAAAALLEIGGAVSIQSVTQSDLAR